MATFRVGQRVRIIAVRQPENGWRVGQEDVVVGHRGIYLVLKSHPLPNGCNCSHPDDLAPILPQNQHEPCESDFKRDLDRLLEKQGVPA